MKKLFVFLLISLIIPFSFGQIAVVNYMKVPDGGEDSYLSVEKQWKDLHQKLVNEGKKLAWEVLYVHNTGTESEYNFVTIDVYSSMDQVLNPGIMDDLKSVWGDKVNDILKKTDQVRKRVYVETSVLDFGIPDQKPGKYIMMTYMKAADPQKYLKMEQTTYMPMHKAAISHDKLNGWEIWTPVLFEKDEYNAVAVNSYASADQIGYMDYPSLFKEATMNMNGDSISEMYNMLQNTDQIRKIVKCQIWELVDMTQPKQEKK